jgi:glycosyltransferase involved in cell wall biosynthesis
LKCRLLVIGPLPPPYHGVTISTSLVLANDMLRRSFDVEHLDTSDRRAKGVATWDVRNIILALRASGHLLLRLRGRRGVVYFPLSQSVQGFIRDSLFVHFAAGFGWKTAAHLRGGELHRFHAKQPWLLRRWIELTLGRVDAFAVMGESLRPVLSGLVPNGRITVVSNGTPAPNTGRVAREPRTVVFLSNLRKRKGVVEAVQAAQIVLRQEPSARFVFAGEWESDDLSDLLRRQTSGEDRITFVTGVKGGQERDRLLATGAVLLFPPIEPEGHPRVVLEALAAGLPVVTTDRGAIAETVVDGETGFVLADPVPELLASRLLLLLRDDDLRQKMSSSARDRYLEHFTQEIADRKLADWLGAVAAA